MILGLRAGLGKDEDELKSYFGTNKDLDNVLEWYGVAVGEE